MAKSHYTEERWKPVVGYEGLYEVSDKGRVKSLARPVTDSRGVVREYNERILKPFTNHDGYQQIKLRKDGERLIRTVHSLVLEAFVEPRPEGMVCCHANDVPDDNRVENLRWDTPIGNMGDMIKNGGHRNQKKVACPRGHEHSEANNVAAIAARGARKCLACDRTRSYIRKNPEFKPWATEISDRVYGEITGGTYARGYTKEAADKAVMESIVTEVLSQIVDQAA